MATAIVNSPAMLSVIGKINHVFRAKPIRISMPEFDMDTRLGCLNYEVASLPTSFNREMDLIQAGVLVFGWLQAMGLSLDNGEIALKIADERLRQRRLFYAGKLNFNVAAPNTPTGKRMRVLIEEIGEVAKAIDELESSPRNPKLRAHLIVELIQVAAVIVAWLESYEVAS